MEKQPLVFDKKTTSRITGPSQCDLDLAQSYNLPGILRDYKGPEITGGHDINDSYKDITFGPTKRPDIQYNGNYSAPLWKTFR